MRLKHCLIAAATAALLAGPALADMLEVSGAYARVAGPAARSGAIFLEIHNHGNAEDRLVGVASDAAELVELHTHRESAEGVMQMVKVEEGFAVPAHGSHVLARGGDHVMLMGLTRPLADGDEVALRLTFESGTVLDVTAPVAPDAPAAAAPTGGHSH